MSFGGGVSPPPSLHVVLYATVVLKDSFLRLNKLLSRGTRDVTRTTDVPRVYI